MPFHARSDDPKRKGTKSSANGKKWGEGLLEKGRVQHVIPLALEMERRTDFLYTEVTGLGAVQLGGTGKMRKSSPVVARRGVGSGTEGANSSTGTRGGGRSKK